jgi:surface antigen
MMLYRLAASVLITSAVLCSVPAEACSVPGLSDILRSNEAALVERTCDYALERGRVGEAFKFQDPHLETMGSVVSGEAYRDRRGVYCRRLTITLIHPANGRLERRRWPGVACRHGRRDWQWADVEIREAGESRSTPTGMRQLQQRY